MVTGAQRKGSQHKIVGEIDGVMDRIEVCD